MFTHWADLSGHTAGFILKVLGVYIHPIETIYLSLRVQVAVGTFFAKSPVYINTFILFVYSE